MTWLRAAAVVAVLLGAGVLASPARAWVADWIAARWAQLSGGSVPAGVTPPAPAAAPQGGSTRVEFTPSGTDFSVDFAAPQTAGGLTVRRGQHPAALAEIVQGSAELLILPDGIRVANASSSTAEYRLTLPPRVRRVQIRVGDTMLRIVTPLESGVDERVDLSAETR